MIVSRNSEIAGDGDTGSGEPNPSDGLRVIRLTLGVARDKRVENAIRHSFSCP
jgi:hypothetical protein